MFEGRIPEPVTVNAHHPLLMHGYGAFETAFQRSKKAPEKLKALAECKASALVRLRVVSRLRLGGRSGGRDHGEATP